MNRIFLLLKAQAVNYFFLNEIFGQRGGKRGPVFITAAGILTLLLFLGGYNVLTAVALVSMGQQDMIPAYMVAVSSFIILVFTLLRSNGILFGSRDFEMLCALPLEAGEMISSKFGFLYLINLAFSVLFMVPAGVVWLTGTGNHGVPFFFYLVSVFFVPLLPMCVASAAGFVITLLSAGSRRKNLLSLVFSFGALGAFTGGRALRHVWRCRRRGPWYGPCGADWQALPPVRLVPLSAQAVRPLECGFLACVRSCVLGICEGNSGSL